MRRALPLLALLGCALSPGRSAENQSLPATQLAPTLVRLTATSTAAAKWDVEQMPGETSEAKIDTDEGTWLSLDVSPDGKTIAFDLLGDLYVMPIGGGEATRISAGAAWEMQPRFSPDGAWIAFISDRDGMDNLWLIKPDGTGARQVSKEKENELSSPAWTPDGRFVAVRKHFTAERSLGAGEIWLFHRSGGSGSMMTKRPNEQKDLGEPAFSPDGRFLYFTQDVTPGKFFEYNKNPYDTIYVTKRLELDSGRIDRFIDMPGGSVTPTPSPDGRSIAFVRRVGLKTALFLHDVASNGDRMLFDGLDRDMQETWAVQGVYPGFDWTPDGRSIVVWAGGKILRVDARDGQAHAIPFHVADTRKVWKAVRFPVEVHPKRFHTKMLRWITASPDGKRAVFQTFGRIWIRELPNGKPRRLTDSKEDLFEQHPSFSRDGRSVVFTTWSDRELGSVRTVSAGGGASRTITSVPGHYVEPVFSPDGARVVYRKTGWDDPLRSNLYTQDPGLYVIPAKGGEPHLVTREGHDPYFAAENDRVYYRTEEGEGDASRRVLASIELDGSDPRKHAKVALGSELVLSPDGKRLAFRWNYQAYVAPFSPTGQAVDLGPESKSVPVVRVSKDAGTNLHFSGDGNQLYWSMGPVLFARDLRDAFAEVEGAPEKKPPVADQGTDLGFDVDSDIPVSKIAIVGGRLVTMKGDEVIDEGVVLIDHNRITAVGPRSSTAIPKDARVIDAAGTTIIPGLVDVHHHGPQGDDGLIPQANWALHSSLSFGVTTVHDPSADTATIFAASELARAGIILAPRIFSTGTILYGGHVPVHAQIDSLDDALNHLRRMKAVGAISVKSYRQRRRSQRQQVLAAARQTEMMVVPEGASMFEANMSMVVDGHTGVEHAVPVAKVYRDVEQLWSQTEVGWTPTQVVAYGGLWGENYWYQHMDVFAHPRLTAFVPSFVLEPRARRRMMASDGDWNHFAVARTAKQLSDAGVRVNLGAHGQREGLAVHWELWMFVQGGATPHQALRNGTINGAHYLGMDGDIGSIEPGKLADLAIIDGDVLKDIRTSENVRYTVLNGRVYDAATMNEVAPEKRARRTFYWETSPREAKSTGDRF